MADTPITPSVGALTATGIAGPTGRGVVPVVGACAMTGGDGGAGGGYSYGIFAGVGTLTIPTGDASPTGAVVLNSGQTGLAKDGLTLGVGT